MGGTLAISPDGRFLALGSGSPFYYTRPSVLKVWDLSTLEEVRTPLLENGSTFVAVSFTPSGQSLIAVDHHGMLRIWKTADWSLDREWQVGRASSIALSPDGKTIAIGRWRGGTVSLWDFESGDQLRVLGDHVAFGLAFFTRWSNACFWRS